MQYDIRDPALAERGEQHIAWAARTMPVLRQIATDFATSRLFAGRRIAAALHLTSETAVLMRALQAGGASIALYASNPLSTRDDICAALVKDGMQVYAIQGEDLATYQRHLAQALATDPHLVLDDGADLIVELHQRPERGATVFGIEETTTGVTRVRAMVEAAPLGDLFVTATGIAGVIRPEHMLAMKDGAMLANSGHFDVEVDVAGLQRLAASSAPMREHVVAYQLPNGRTLFLLAEGRLVGQVAAEASPAAVMDLSFADQALSAAYLFTQGQDLAPGVYAVPTVIDEQVAQRKLAALAVRIDTLDQAQRRYQQDWQLGTSSPDNG